MSNDNGAAPDKVVASNVIRLLGEDIRLVRPKGLAGLRFITKAQAIFKHVLEELEPYQDKVEGQEEGSLVVTSETLGLMVELMDEEFIDTVIPAFYMYSTMGLSKEEAKEHFETREMSIQAVSEIFQAFVGAMIGHWASSDDPEALDAAQKKSKGAKEEMETTTES
jgi:hypothetical protein